VVRRPRQLERREGAGWPCLGGGDVVGLRDGRRGERQQHSGTARRGAARHGTAQHSGAARRHLGDGGDRGQLEGAAAAEGRVRLQHHPVRPAPGPAPAPQPRLSPSTFPP
jgi:hypothetical protein